jgi:hypothetical protein
MLLLLHKEQLRVIAQTLSTLPSEGSDLSQLLERDYTRTTSLRNIVSNAESLTHNTEPPVTIIDDYWGLRLGLLNG